MIDRLLAEPADPLDAMIDRELANVPANAGGPASQRSPESAALIESLRASPPPLPGRPEPTTEEAALLAEARANPWVPPGVDRYGMPTVAEARRAGPGGEMRPPVPEEITPLGEFGRGIKARFVDVMPEGIVGEEAKMRAGIQRPPAGFAGAAGQMIGMLPGVLNPARPDMTSMVLGGMAVQPQVMAFAARLAPRIGNAGAMMVARGIEGGVLNATPAMAAAAQENPEEWAADPLGKLAKVALATGGAAALGALLGGGFGALEGARGPVPAAPANPAEALAAERAAATYRGREGSERARADLADLSTQRGIPEVPRGTPPERTDIAQTANPPGAITPPVARPAEAVPPEVTPSARTPAPQATPAPDAAPQPRPADVRTAEAEWSDIARRAEDAGFGKTTAEEVAEQHGGDIGSARQWIEGVEERDRVEAEAADSAREARRESSSGSPASGGQPDNVGRVSERGAVAPNPTRESTAPTGRVKGTKPEPARVDGAGEAAAPKTTENPPGPPTRATEAQQPDPDARLTSARKAMVAEDRQAMGLDQLNSPERRGWETDLADAREQGIPDKARHIAAEVLDSPRSLSSTETAGLVEATAKLKNEHAKAMDAISKAYDPADLRSASAEATRIEAEHDLLTRALLASGTEKGRALAAQKLTLDQDFSLVAVKNRAKAAQGKALTPEQSAKFETLTKELAEKARAYDELAAKMDERMAEDSVRRHKSGRKRDPAAHRAERESLMAKVKELLTAGCKD